MGFLDRIFRGAEPEIDEPATEELTLKELWRGLAERNKSRHSDFGRDADNASCLVCGRYTWWAEDSAINLCGACKKEFETWCMSAEAKELLNTISPSNDFMDVKVGCLKDFWAIRQAIAYDVSDCLVDESTARIEFMPVRRLVIEAYSDRVRKVQDIRRQEEEKNQKKVAVNSIANRLS